METRANYVLIGAFVFIAAAALMLFTVWVSGGALNREYARYDVVFEGPVNGLTEGGEVRFNGIKVGEVQQLSLDRQDPNRVIARIRVDAQTPVRTDSVAQLDFLGITGVTFIQIRAGSPQMPLVDAEMGEIPVIRTERTALDELFSGGRDLLTVLGETINRVDDALSDENIASLTATMNNVEAISAKLAAQDGMIDSASSALRSIDRAAVSLASAAASIESAAKTFDAGFGEISTEALTALKDVRPAFAELREAVANVNGAVQQINRDVTPSAGRAMEQFSQAAMDLRVTMIRLQSMLNDIDQDPSQFIYRQPLPVEGGK